MLGRVFGVSNVVTCFEPRALCLISKSSIPEPHNQLIREFFNIGLIHVSSFSEVKYIFFIK